MGETSSRVQIPSSPLHIEAVGLASLRLQSAARRNTRFLHDGANRHHFSPNRDRRTIFPEAVKPELRAPVIRVPEALDRLIELYTAHKRPDEVKK